MQTPNQTPAPLKAKRGRPAGSNSFVKVSMKDLMRLVGEGGAVSVSKVWLREMGVSLEEKPVALVITPAVEIAAPEEKIEFKIETFEEDED